LIAPKKRGIREQNTASVEQFDFSVPGLELPACRPSDQIVKHYAYTLNYDEENEQAKWVAYRLDSLKAKGKIERRGTFKADPMVLSGSAKSGDYTNSGYDRGHLAPAGDFKWSETAMSESFYMSNISPNRRDSTGEYGKIWKRR
jgi:endonuclease G